MNFPSLCLGADGLISVLAVPCPDVTEKICRFTLNGEIERARQLHYLSLPLIRALFQRVNPVIVKGLMAKQGYCTGHIRLPLTCAKASLIQEADAACKALLRAGDGI